MKGQLVRRRSAIAIVTTCAVMAGGLGAGGVSSAEPAAHAAKRRHHLTLSGTAYLHLVKRRGSVLYERGRATGTLPGTVTARFVAGITKVTGTVTFHPRGHGSLTLTAIGYPQSSGRITKFTGNVAVRRGSGRFRRALGSGTFYGTANRRSWAVTVHASANLTY